MRRKDVKEMGVRITNDGNWPVQNHAQFLILSGEVADQIDFCLTIRCSVWAEHFVEPDGWLVRDVGMLPGVPR